MNAMDTNQRYFHASQISINDKVTTTNDIWMHINEHENDMYRTIAGIAGNVLEWYDFALFGFFGDVIADVFFPKQAGHAALIQSFAIFGGAFIVRPLGGMIIGYIGDLYGRKKALEISIFLMAFPTFAMGLLPSYERVGPLAIVLLAIVRIFQGLSVGGQLVSSLVFTVESKPREKWGWYGSWVFASANFGTFLGGLVAFILRHSLDEEALALWGWRVPFLAGIVVSVSGFYLRYYCDEDLPLKNDDSNKESFNPIVAAFEKGNRRSLLSAALVPMLWAGGFYLTFVWMAIFMGDLLDPPIKQAFALNSASLFLLCVWFPLIGLLSDKFGRVTLMTIGALLIGIMGPIMMYVISLGNTYSAFFAQSFMGLSLSLWGSPMCAWLVETFPQEARLTSVAVGYNIALALLGGTTPAIATYLFDAFGVHSPSFILTFVSILSLTGLYMAPKTNLKTESASEIFHNYGKLV